MSSLTSRCGTSRSDVIAKLVDRIQKMDPPDEQFCLVLRRLAPTRLSDFHH